MYKKRNAFCQHTKKHIHLLGKSSKFGNTIDKRLTKIHIDNRKHIAYTQNISLNGKDPPSDGFDKCMNKK